MGNKENRKNQGGLPDLFGVDNNNRNHNNNIPISSNINNDTNNINNFLNKEELLIISKT